MHCVLRVCESHCSVPLTMHSFFCFTPHYWPFFPNIWVPLMFTEKIILLGYSPLYWIKKKKSSMCKEAESTWNLHSLKADSSRFLLNLSLSLFFSLSQWARALLFAFSRPVCHLFCDTVSQMSLEIWLSALHCRKHTCLYFSVSSINRHTFWKHDSSHYPCHCVKAHDLVLAWCYRSHVHQCLSDWNCKVFYMISTKTDFSPVGMNVKEVRLTLWNFVRLRWLKNLNKVYTDSHPNFLFNYLSD